MPRITLPSSAAVYDLYERLVAAALGVTTDKSTEALTSPLPRTCAMRKIVIPDEVVNAGLLFDFTGQLTHADVQAGDSLLEQSDLNRIPIAGVKVQASGNNAVLDVTIELV